MKRRYKFLTLCSIVLAATISCKQYMKENTYDVTLPNGYTTQGMTTDSQAYPGHTNVKSSEMDLVSKSRITGTVTYIGYPVGEDGSKFTEPFIIRMKPESQLDEYVMRVKQRNVEIGYLAELIRKGATISVPTLRKYDSPNNTYRMLTLYEQIFSDEVKFVSSPRIAEKN